MTRDELYDWIWEPFFTSGGEWVPAKERMEQVRARAVEAGVGDHFEVYR